MCLCNTTRRKTVVSFNCTFPLEQASTLISHYSENGTLGIEPSLGKTPDEKFSREAFLRNQSAVILSCTLHRIQFQSHLFPFSSFSGDCGRPKAASTSLRCSSSSVLSTGCRLGICKNSSNGNHFQCVCSSFSTG